ncbi:polysaccharide biosynthesis/export family protein [Sulfitobacter sp. D35]|uniref:polysaccharide biosynthesis/export family protein n=1 Tax=Sulfitobacter sp. D35 TaxID=3083252 RepID=UPI00296FBD2F|nr:polysaccharide biosynthesis/export family protein [Sulfitobacter sp. D35]MDW4498534.1 polysaccharide biosynthesis/export family protein [Sulfitobacter sp. D35]
MTLVGMRGAVSALGVLAIASCGTGARQDNIETVAAGNAYQAQYRPLEARSEVVALQSPSINAAKCLPFAGGSQGGKLGGRTHPALRGELLSRGDLVDVRLPDDTTFTGEYVVSRDGRIKLPYLPAIAAEGRTARQVSADIRRALIAGGYYDIEPDISLLVMDFATASIGVSGAVFDPQGVSIGGVQGDQLDSRRQAALGASTEGRNLSAALRGAGGVRPDADLSAVRITRAGTNYIVDLRGALDGYNYDDVMLLNGDEIYVPSRQCFQDDLMRPSPVSPPGVSLYLSNLTQPATGNAPSAIGQTVREVPYGTRYIQAVVDANCVGGARATSANRSAALFSRNPVSGVSVVVERRIEEMRSRADRDDYDPYVLPGDAIACYDSGTTNLGEVGRLLGIFTAAAVIIP